MTDYTTIQAEFEAKLFATPRAFRMKIIQHLLFAAVRDDKEKLINFLRECGVPDVQIAKRIGQDKSSLSRTYPRGGKK